MTTGGVPMTRAEDLQAQVDGRWAELDQPAWPPARGFRDSPADEEYSRVSDPARYRIVHERARVWAEVLGELPGVSLEPLGPGLIPVAGGDAPLAPFRYDRGTRLVCDRPRTLPLLFLERSGGWPGEAQLAVLHIAVVEPGVTLSSHPGCCCDACDDGSEAVLGSIDSAVLAVVGGPFALIRAPRWEARWHLDGSSSGGDGAGPDHEEVTALCRRLAMGEDPTLPRGARAYAGGSWRGPPAALRTSGSVR